MPALHRPSCMISNVSSLNGAKQQYTILKFQKSGSVSGEQQSGTMCMYVCIKILYVCMLYCFHHQSECLGLCWPPNVFCRSPTMLQPYPDSAQVMDAPDLTSAVERGVYFNWLLEIVPGTVGNVYANHLILQADRRDGLWFAGDAASSATWRPGWWCISQDPGEIRVCFAWRDVVRATERVYTRHPQFTSTRAPLPGRPRTSSCCCR